MRYHFNQLQPVRLLLLLFLCLYGSLLLAASATAAVARGYTTKDTDLRIGMVVSLSTSGVVDEVERASQEEASRIIGVAVRPQDSLVAVGSAESGVFVETEGQADVYVSDIAGEVKRGDILVVSPLKGVLMKSSALTSDKVIGVAASDMGSTSVYDYKDGAITKQTNIAIIKVDLSYLGVAANNGVVIEDTQLDRIGRALVGRDIGEVRVIIALVVFVIVLIAEGGILYGAISSAISALGRNPLARGAIRGELVRVILVAFGVLLIGLGSIYAILWV